MKMLPLNCVDWTWNDPVTPVLSMRGIACSLCPGFLSGLQFSCFRCVSGPVLREQGGL
jgi:hypothetical protein